MDTIRSDIAAREAYGFPVATGERTSARELLVQDLGRCADRASLSAGLKALTHYVSASHFLLVRHDLSFDTDSDCVVASDWPFDLVRKMAPVATGGQNRMSELEKCLGLFQPAFAHIDDTYDVPAGLSREYCVVAFNVGRVRMSLLLLFQEHFILSQSKLRDVGLMTGYFASVCCEAVVRAERDLDLTDREVECLYWIAEGKTSDEIAVILGISKNTINNYITSVMRKTATKTRSEAIAWAVRNGLV
ncbi:helix-turn-helix domain-containing protein [Rhizobium sp. TRM95111]|uniref:transcriptional regulator VisN n=1 Tax=Rhizobium alarense TaxID=2846851 RepID=UPI001F2FD12C|nr:helix-turn-helix domain-containing protein [Rhizobium alarense]MCF3641736.1 helix-turn-helix domain-containing protein [Rhizobium alarense]